MVPLADQITGLTVAGCRARQRLLSEQLLNLGIDRILICDRRHVYYLSGYWSAWYHAPLLVVAAEGTSHLVAPDTASQDGLAADQISAYPAHRLGTLIDDQLGSALQQLGIELSAGSRWGTDLPHHVLAEHRSIVDLSSLLLKLRRAKHADEVELIRHAVRACEAAYAEAAQMLQPGLREIDVFAQVQSAAVRALGEPIGELGNDFQSGTPGGPPRTRKIEQGELMPLDVAVSVRGYRCDLCRTFAVGRAPTDKQREAARLVQSAIEFFEQHARVGSSCRELYEEIHRMLDGVHGWRFFHHLGHGTGLSAHEAPRLNPDWDDRLEIGDLFTVEPGLYHEELRGGVRIEENYWLTEDGLCRLSTFPTAL